MSLRYPQVAAAPLPVQVRPVLQVRFAQQRSPEAPQAMQLSAPAPPSAAGVLTQLKPTLQVLVAPQQAWPAPPQTSQVPGLPLRMPTQPSPVEHGVAPGQQACPEEPHASQLLAPPPPAGAGLQRKPALQALFAQQT